MALDVNVVPQSLIDLLQLKGGRIGLQFVPQIIPVVDLQQHLVTLNASWVETTIVVNSIRFVGLVVPQDESWTIIALGSMTDTLDADQTITLQTAIQRPDGQVYGVSFMQPIGNSERGGRGGEGIFPMVLQPGEGIGVQINIVDVGAAANIDVNVGVLRSIQRT